MTNRSLDRRDFLNWMIPAGFGLCSCFGCRTTPITQRRQLLLIPESQELQMGVAAYDEVKTKNKLSTNAKYNEIVTRVGQRLAEAAKQQNLGTNFDWEFTVIADQTQNAFCLPGGKVAFYEGILPVCQNEAGVAVVMSHEISHALARHGGERMTQQMGVDGGGKILQAVVKRKAADKEQAFMAVYNTGTKYGFVLPYSRSHESEADEMGIHIMSQAGYDPHEAPKFWERFGAAKSGDAPPEFASTHPSDATRAAALRALLPQAVEEYQASPTKHGVGVPLA
ncbi:peptidase M48 [Planctomycetia bacterium]|nr:peptidase M48 [Planctomycetia bacterium]